MLVLASVNSIELRFSESEGLFSHSSVDLSSMLEIYLTLVSILNQPNVKNERQNTKTCYRGSVQIDTYIPANSLEEVRFALLKE